MLKESELVHEFINARLWINELQIKHPEFFKLIHNEAINHAMKQTGCTRQIAEEALKGLLMINDKNFIEPIGELIPTCGYYYLYFKAKKDSFRG